MLNCEWMWHDYRIWIEQIGNELWNDYMNCEMLNCNWIWGEVRCGYWKWVMKCELCTFKCIENVYVAWLMRIRNCEDMCDSEAEPGE